MKLDGKLVLPGMLVFSCMYVYMCVCMFLPHVHIPESTQRFYGRLGDFKKTSVHE